MTQDAAGVAPAMEPVPAVVGEKGAAKEEHVGVVPGTEGGVVGVMEAEGGVVVVMEGGVVVVMEGGVVGVMEAEGDVGAEGGVEVDVGVAAVDRDSSSIK